MSNIGLGEWLLILLVGVLFFGAKRLPELGQGLGRAIRSFNKGLKSDEDTATEKRQDENV